MAAGELEPLLLNSAVELPWLLRVKIAHDIAQGLLYLHNRTIVHRDIKCANVLIDDKWRAVLGDYGFARKADSARAMTMCGSDEYMAPEVIWGDPYDVRVDMYSFGLVLVALMTRRAIGKGGFLERKPKNKFQLDMDELHAAVPADCPTSLLECAVQCLAEEPDARLTSEEAADWLEEMVEELGGASAIASMPAPPTPASPDSASLASPAGTGTMHDAKAVPRPAAAAPGLESVAE